MLHIKKKTLFLIYDNLYIFCLNGFFIPRAISLGSLLTLEIV